MSEKFCRQKISCKEVKKLSTIKDYLFDTNFWIVKIIRTIKLSSDNRKISARGRTLSTNIFACEFIFCSFWNFFQRYDKNYLFVKFSRSEKLNYFFPPTNVAMNFIVACWFPPPPSKLLETLSQRIFLVRINFVPLKIIILWENCDECELCQRPILPLNFADESKKLIFNNCNLFSFEGWKVSSKK